MNYIDVELDANVQKNPFIKRGGRISDTTLALSVGLVWLPMTATGSHRPTATATRLGPCKVRVDIANDGNLPRIFLPIAPNINYAYSVILTQNADGTVSTEIASSRHDGFPAYELFVDGSLEYSHSPQNTGEGIWSLWGAGEHGR